MADKTVKNVEETNEEKFERLQREAEELVEIRLFRDNGNYKDDVYVNINDENFVIKRGEVVKVPRKVAIILEQKEAARNAAFDYMEGLQKESSV